MKISQSLIKDVKQFNCSELIKLKYQNFTETEPTKAMMSGLYFESELIGSARGGKFEYPLLKNGKKSKAQTDIDVVIKKAKEVFKAMNIEVSKVQYQPKREFIIGAIDFIGTIESVKAIFDVKYTGLSFEQYERELKYSPLRENLEIQASHYQKMLEEEELDFYFLVFSEKGWHRVFKQSYSQEVNEIATERIIDTMQKLEVLETQKDNRICAKCRLNDVCTKQVLTAKIEELCKA